MDTNFDEAVAKVTKIVGEEGFNVMLVKSLDEIFKKKLNIEYPKYTIILACGPKFAKAALDVSKDVGLLFPCSFAVYEEAGKIYVSHISIMKIAPAIGLAPESEMKHVIEMTGDAVHRAWERF
ncbi:DUF302 domain-containing protein [Candidatus Harpocratesius sp.]